MDENIRPGDLVFLTRAFDAYIRKKNPSSKVSLINRLAKVEEIIDWESEKGRRIKKAREESGKWKGLPIEENKYVLSIYYHDLVGRQGQRGVAERGVPMFRGHPETGTSFFEKVPDWIYKEIIKKCETFDVVLKDSVDVA